MSVILVRVLVLVNIFTYISSARIFKQLKVFKHQNEEINDVDVIYFYVDLDNLNVRENNAM